MPALVPLRLGVNIDHVATVRNARGGRLPDPLRAAAIAAAAGSYHSCAVLSGGSMQCWGYNWNGQLGNGVSGLSPWPHTVVGF